MAVYEKRNNVNVWWFPKEFCQSRFGEYRESGTNSCTLISLLLADALSKDLALQMATRTGLPQRTIEIFGNAMNEGNRVYSRIFKRFDDKNKHKTDPNLSIPEAIRALVDHSSLHFDLQEWFYTHLTANPNKETYEQTVAARIAQVLKLVVQLFKKPRSNVDTRSKLFAALIADQRTSTFVFEFPNNVVTVFDSHQHGRQSGAVVAQCSIDNLEDLAHWFILMLGEIYNSRPGIYEISFLTTAADAPHLVSPI